ncbi:hypothetical protein CTheo_5296 [Ceratobasidium theobromae]|uniref:Uncharacterized protein n=1 Tax=Ceratobasidium theobromae TaxID=1582974 RepID=A0A5N5QHW8_9AGAM|nr:hypothetical protein CTheo_5296 [Ceratobasidium theobromae]
MRLITHNILACHARGCDSNNFPLSFKDAQVEIIEAEFSPQFLIKFIPRLDWNALVATAREVRPICHPSSHSHQQLGDDSLPDTQPDSPDDPFLRKLHHVLFEVGFGPSLPS